MFDPSYIHVAYRLLEVLAIATFGYQLVLRDYFYTGLVLIGTIWRALSMHFVLVAPRPGYSVFSKQESSIVYMTSFKWCQTQPRAQEKEKQISRANRSL